MWRTRFFVGVWLAGFVLLANVGTASKETSTMATSAAEAAAAAKRRAAAYSGSGSGTLGVTPTYSYTGPDGSYGVESQYPISVGGGDPYGGEPTAPSGGYDTGYAAAPAPRMLASSPEWLAYLNALGLEEQQARADVDKQRGLYQSDATRQLQDLPAGYMQQRRGISGSMESRGMARSGEMLRRLAENRANQGRAEANVNAQLGFQLGNLESSLANKLIQLNSARAQQEMNLRAQGYQ